MARHLRRSQVAAEWIPTGDNQRERHPYRVPAAIYILFFIAGQMAAADDIDVSLADVYWKFGDWDWNLKFDKSRGWVESHSGWR